MKYLINNTMKTIKFIGVYQIFGGILGIGLTGWLMFNTEVLNGPMLFIFTLALFLYGFSIQSGSLLLQKSKQKKGLIFSSILQGVQIIAIGIGKYSYDFSSGAKGAIGFNFGNGFDFNFGVLSSFHFKINSGVPEYFIKFNILAMVIFSILIEIILRKKN